jgi:hypothetical protein
MNSHVTLSRLKNITVFKFGGFGYDDYVAGYNGNGFVYYNEMYSSSIYENELCVFISEYENGNGDSDFESNIGLK